MKKNRHLINGAAFLFFVVLSVIHTYPMVLNIKSETPISLSSICFIYATSEQSILFFKEAPFDFYKTFDPSIAGPLKSPFLLCPYGFGTFLLFAPFYLLTGNLYFAANMFLFVVLSCSAFSLFLLSKYLTGSIRAGLIGGTVFVFTTPSFALLRDLYLLNLIVFPLIFLYFFRFISEQKKKFLVYTAVLLALDFYLVVYHFIFAFYLLLIISLIKWKTIFTKRNVDAIFYSSAIAVFLALPLAIPYVLTRFAYGVSFHSMDLKHVFPNFPGEWLSVTYENVLYGRWLAEPRYAGDPTIQLEFFPGALIWIMLLIGASKADIKLLSGRFYLSVLVAVILFTTSWYPFYFMREGHEGSIPHLYTPIFRYLPFAEYIKILLRYIVVFNFCAAILVAGGYVWLEKKIKREHVNIGFALLLALISAENLSIPRKMYKYDEIFGPGEAAVWLKKSSILRNRSDAILYIPYEFGKIRKSVPEARALLDFLVPNFRHLYLRQPTYTNIFSYSPRGYTPAEMGNFPEIVSQKYFRAIGTKVVVVYEALLDDDDRVRYGKKNMTEKGLRHLITVGKGENVYFLERKLAIAKNIVVYGESRDGRIGFYFATPEYYHRRVAGGLWDTATADEYWVNPKHCMNQTIEVSAVDTKGERYTAEFTYNLPLVIGETAVRAFEWDLKAGRRYRITSIEYEEDYIVNGINSPLLSLADRRIDREAGQESERALALAGGKPGPAPQLEPGKLPSANAMKMHSGSNLLNAAR